MWTCQRSAQIRFISYTHTHTHTHTEREREREERERERERERETNIQGCNSKTHYKKSQ